CGVRVQRPSQPISNQYLCSLALLVFKDQARGQRLIRSSVLLKFLLSHFIQHLSCSRYFGHSLANFGSKVKIEVSARSYLDCLGGLPSFSKEAYWCTIRYRLAERSQHARPRLLDTRSVARRTFQNFLVPSRSHWTVMVASYTLQVLRSKK
ncbi:unnamed protein product, partial [Hymenolepis diminuta]